MIQFILIQLAFLSFAFDLVKTIIRNLAVSRYYNVYDYVFINWNAPLSLSKGINLDCCHIPVKLQGILGKAPR